MGRRRSVNLPGLPPQTTAQYELLTHSDHSEDDDTLRSGEIMPEPVPFLLSRWTAFPLGLLSGLIIATAVFFSIMLSKPAIKNHSPAQATSQILGRKT